MNLNDVARSMTKLSFESFVENCRYPHKAENLKWDYLKKIFSQGQYWNKKTKEKNLEDISISDFPITNYCDYQVAIEQSLRTGVCPFTGEEIIFFADSAGTTSDAKIFPITQIYQNDYQQTQEPFIHSLANRHQGFMNHGILYLAAVDTGKTGPLGIKSGYISHFNYLQMPENIANHYALPKEIFKDEQTFQAWAPVYALQKDISAIFAVTGQTIINLLDYIKENKQDLLAKLSGNIPTPNFLPNIKISRERFSHLKKILSEESLNFEKIWPGLSFISTWTSSVAGLLTPTLKQKFPDIPVVDAIYSATEAWMNVPMHDLKPGGPLCHDAMIAEFIPVDKEIKEEHLLRSWQLEAGCDYEIFITNSMGLIRYRLQDVIRCISHYLESPEIYFRHKAGNIISLVTMRLSESQILSALEQSGIAQYSQLKVAPTADGTGLELAIGEEMATELDLKAFDFELQKISPYYKEERNSAHLKAAIARILPNKHPFFQAGSFHAQTKPKLLVQEPF